MEQQASSTPPDVHLNPDSELETKVAQPDVCRQTPRSTDCLDRSTWTTLDSTTLDPWTVDRGALSEDNRLPPIDERIERILDAEQLLNAVNALAAWTIDSTLGIADHARWNDAKRPQIAERLAETESKFENAGPAPWNVALTRNERAFAKIVQGAEWTGAWKTVDHRRFAQSATVA